MKRWPLNRKPARDPEAATTVAPGATGPTGWVFGVADAAISAGMLLLTVAVCLPLALHYRAETKRFDLLREAALDQARMVRATVEHMEARRTAHTRLRRAVDHYVAEVQARPMVPWTTVVGELSRRRPSGVWAVRLAGDGPRFRAEVATRKPGLVGTFAQSLRESPYVDFAALPAGAVPEQAREVVGRMTGE